MKELKDMKIYIVDMDSYTCRKVEEQFWGIPNVQVVDGLGIFIEAEEDNSIANLSEEQKFDHLKNKVAAFGFKLGDDYSCKKPYMILHSNIG